MRSDERRRHHRPPEYLGRGQQVRLLALVVGLGMVLLVMNRLREADVVAALGRVFGLQRPMESTAVDDITEEEIAALLDRGGTAETSPDVVRLVPRRSHGETGSATVDQTQPLVIDPALLASIEDNTRFRAAEVDAWFHILGILAAATSEEIAAASKGDMSYLQLLRQPEVYRGQVISISGTARQSIVVTPAHNELGLDACFRLVIRPDGGTWPVVAYVLELPPGFPRAAEIEEIVRLEGYFFKNWSYSQQQGLGLAPVLLARDIQWQAASANLNRPSNRSVPSLASVVLLAAALAGVTTAWLWWRTARPGGGKRPELPERLEWTPTSKQDS